MEGNRTLIILIWLLGLLPAGWGCRWLHPQPKYTPPPVFTAQPTLSQIVEVVNRNSSKIQTFSTNHATLSGPGLPTLRASVVFERPRRLRLRAETGLSGPELDLGSNDELFWIWIRRNEPKALYYCRHHEFATSPVRQTLPIEPEWLIEALGITGFDPALAHQGPTPLGEGRLQVTTVIDSPQGTSRKATIVDGRSGLVLEQHLYDKYDQLVASAVARSHRQDPLTGVVMPRVVDVRCPLAGLSLRIDLGNVQVNRPDGAHPSLFTLPQYDGWPSVNLCDPAIQFGPPSADMARRNAVRQPTRHPLPKSRR
jgi:hypothetical protein